MKTSRIHMEVRHREGGDGPKRSSRGKRVISHSLYTLAGELACHVVQSGKYIALSAFYVENS
jgi:hypothetical protein